MGGEREREGGRGRGTDGGDDKLKKSQSEREEFCPDLLVVILSAVGSQPPVMHFGKEALIG